MATTVKIICMEYLSSRRLGVIRSACCFAAEHMPPFELPSAYINELDNLHRIVTHMRFPSSFATASRKECFVPAGAGLYLVSKIRNKLAHGAADLPLPDEWGDGAAETKHDWVVLLETCQRILLFSIQFLVGLYYRGKEVYIEWLDFDYASFDVSRLALRLHLHFSCCEDDQLDLFQPYGAMY